MREHWYVLPDLSLASILRRLLSERTTSGLCRTFWWHFCRAARQNERGPLEYATVPSWRSAQLGASRVGGPTEWSGGAVRMKREHVEHYHSLLVQVRACTCTNICTLIRSHHAHSKWGEINSSNTSVQRRCIDLYQLASLHWFSSHSTIAHSMRCYVLCSCCSSEGLEAYRHHAILIDLS